MTNLHAGEPHELPLKDGRRWLIPTAGGYVPLAELPYRIRMEWRRYFRARREGCSQCGSQDVLELIWGYPIFSEVMPPHPPRALAGCEVVGDEVDRECQVCGARWSGRGASGATESDDDETQADISGPW